MQSNKYLSKNHEYIYNTRFHNYFVKIYKSKFFQSF